MGSPPKTVNLPLVFLNDRPQVTDRTNNIRQRARLSVGLCPTLRERQMAIFFLRVQTIRRAAGRSITAAAAYRSGERIYDARTGSTFDYSRRQGVAASGLTGWSGGREALWNAAEAAERRRDAVVGREVLVAVPHALSQASQEALLARFAGWLRHKHGVAVDWCLHAPDPEGDQRNWHGHILITSRRVEAGVLGDKTLELDRRPASRHSVEAMRLAWANLANEALGQHGISERIDGRSAARQVAGTGMAARMPMLTLGPAAARFSRRGSPTWAALENARRRTTNALQGALSAVIDATTDAGPDQHQRIR